MNFIENLDNLIKNEGITKTELSRQIGISEGTIRQWYNGKMPTIDKVIKISEYFTISIDELIGLNNIPKNEIIEIYNMLQPDDKKIVDIIFDKYREPGKMSSVSKIG